MLRRCCTPPPLSPPPCPAGQYHGKLKFPSNYPFAPPSVMMITPSGRFKPSERLCLSMSDFHPETWNPAWTAGRCRRVPSTTNIWRRVRQRTICIPTHGAAGNSVLPRIRVECRHPPHTTALHTHEHVHTTPLHARTHQTGRATNIKHHDTAPPAGESVVDVLLSLIIKVAVK